MLEQLSNPDFLLKLSGKLALKLKAAEAKIEADAPKVAFSDAVAVAQGDMCLMDFGKEVARALNTGPRKIIKLLEREGYLFRRDGRLYAHQRYVDLEYFRLIERPHRRPGADEMVTHPQTVITALGREWIFERLRAGKAA